MNLTNVLPRVAVVAALVGSLFCASPAHAQFGGDAFTAGDVGSEVRASGNSTGSQPDAFNMGQPPMLQGSTIGSIGPQVGDATVVSSTNSAGTVRVNNLANVEALLNIAANGIEIIGIVVFFGMMCKVVGLLLSNRGTDAVRRPNDQRDGGATVLEYPQTQPIALYISIAIAALVIGLATPGAINWMVASSYDGHVW